MAPRKNSKRIGTLEPHPGSRRKLPAYLLPALDQAFLLSDSLRGVRFLLEYTKAEEALRAWGVTSTIVVFGSSRVRARGKGAHARWYNEARTFGRIASQRGGALKPLNGKRDNVITTGGGPGLMEAANRGAHDAGAPSIGFNIRLPREQVPNRFTTPELTFQFHYFAMRKMHLAMRASGLVIFPGGFGTLDELFEVLTLRQTGKAPMLPIVLVDRAYWTRVVNFAALSDQGMIEKGDLEHFAFAESAEEVWSTLVKKGLKLPRHIAHHAPPKLRRKAAGPQG
jgi:uncharacterized protein (TIGR00730 family)